jgi:hypothetical protein
MKTYKGSCHCGGIRFTFTGPEIARGLRCNCSICRRKGAVMTEFTVAPDEIIIEAKDGCLTTYQFGNRVAKHQFCNICGIYTFHQTARKPDHYRINIGCIDDVDSLSLPFDIFDGASL